MAAFDDLNALFEQLKKSPSQLSSLLGETPSSDASAGVRRLQQKMPNLQAEIEANLKKGLEIQAEQEAYLKRLRGEEVESDKEKEGNLDEVPDKFEAEHGPKPEQVEPVIKSLLAVVDPDKARNYKLGEARPDPKPGTSPQIRKDKAQDSWLTKNVSPEIREMLKKEGLL
jgi:hypothetical protein